MMQFLNAADIRQMQRDANDVVASAAGANVTVRYLASVTGGSYNAAYREYDGSTKTYTTETVRALQHFVTDRDKDLLEFGFVKIGDCIFSFLLDAVDLDDLDEVTITDSDGAVWVPVMVPTKAFYVYMESRVGNTQLFQAVLARVRQ